VSEYLSEVLGDNHRLDTFTCGKDPLDAWLKSQARRAHGAGTARTYVWTRPGSSAVLAYFSIAATQVVRSDVPRPLTGGYSVIPAYLLARLALDHTLQGRGLGGQTAAGRRGRDHRRRHGGRRHDVISVGPSPRLYLKVATAETVLAKAP